MPEGSCAFTVGSIRCTVLSDGYTTYPAEWYFSNVEPGRFRQALAERRLPRDEVLSPYTCLLIETGRNVILFDTGAGASSQTSGAIVPRLEMAGIRPKDVDTVILSHAHPDHVGGAVDGLGRPLFPNARFVLGEAEWQFWTGWRTDLKAMDVPDGVREHIATSARAALGALRFQVEPIDRECEIASGIRAIPAPGHTPGHLALAVESGSDALLALGDAALHPIHLEQPEWNNALDLSPGCARITRLALLERADRDGMRVMGFHFPFPSVGRLEARAEGGWRWSPGW